MRGIGSKPVEYICSRDRTEPEKHQTVFYLVPRNHERANASSARYARAMRDGTGGEMSEVGMNKADRESFAEYCTQIKNYAFSDDFMSSHPKIAEMANDEGFIAIIDSPELLAEAARDMANSDLMEIAGAVNDPVELTAGLKKK